MQVNASSLASSLLNGGKVTSQSQVGQLSMKDFFTLMAAQLQYQDPMEPMDNTQFMNQMAQFGILEQVASLNSAINYLLAANMVGKSVEYSCLDQATGLTQAGKGTVTAVSMNGTSPECQVNGQWISLSSITRITP